MLSKYQRIIKKYYNPKCETLTEEEYPRLAEGWKKNQPAESKELINKTRFLAYDYVAKLFSCGKLTGNLVAFTEVLQEVSLLVLEDFETLNSIRMYAELPKTFKKYEDKLQWSIKNRLNARKWIDRISNADLYYGKMDAEKVSCSIKNPELLAIKLINRQELFKHIQNTEIGFVPQVKAFYAQYPSPDDAIKHVFIESIAENQDITKTAESHGIPVVDVIRGTKQLTTALSKDPKTREFLK